jgi:hypothetical protein
MGSWVLAPGGEERLRQNFAELTGLVDQAGKAVLGQQAGLHDEL